MKLPQRLEYVFSLTEKCRCAADIGTDHGKLAAALVLSGRAERVIASDVNAGPLSKAEELSEKLGFTDKIDIRLADGLSGMENAGVDQIIIAGMGGELIASIIDAAQWVKNPDVYLVLQPMTTSPELRRYLVSSGFRIKREGAVIEDGKPYEVITAVYSGDIRGCTPEEAEIGGNFEGDEQAVRALLVKKRSALEKRLIGAERKNDGEADVINRLISRINTRLEEL
ncbi:MAG: SAM-dependent methyltransferase [Clostridia bacterium]|nr:SAM-dependent methyltransferase [Clostridia bacterium]